nr:hypothetical protein [Tanacetum cinerariifolium]
MVEDDHDFIYFNNSSDLTLSTRLNNLDFETLNIDGQSMDVEAPPDIIDVVKDDDLNDQKMTFLMINHILMMKSSPMMMMMMWLLFILMSAAVARGHSGDGGGDDPSHLPPRPIRTGCRDTMIYLSGNSTRWYYPSWHKIKEEKKAGVLGRLMMESSENREYSSLIQTFFDIHTDGDKFAQDEARVQYEEMIRFRDLGANTSTGVPYTEDQIIAIVQKGKQWGHISGVGRVLAGQGRDANSINEPRGTYTNADVDEIKEDSKRLKKELDLLRMVVRSDDRMSQLLTLLPSSPYMGGDDMSPGKVAHVAGDSWGGQLNVALMLEVKIFTNWKKRFMCHIIGIEPIFKNIILSGPYVPMTAGVKKPKDQWIGIGLNSTRLECFLSETMLMISSLSQSILNEKGDSPDDEEDTRSSQEYMNDLEMEFNERVLLAKSKRYQVNRNVVQLIEPYERPEPIVTEVDGSLDQTDQVDHSDQADQNDMYDQNDHPVQTDEVLNDDTLEHSNHNNDEHIIDNLTNNEDVHIIEPPSFLTEDTSAPNAVSRI